MRRMGKLVVTLLLCAPAKIKSMDHADIVQSAAEMPHPLSLATDQRAHYLEDRRKGAAQAEDETAAWVGYLYRDIHKKLDVFLFEAGAYASAHYSACLAETMKASSLVVRIKQMLD